MSKLRKLLIETYSKGYRVSNGIVTNAVGKERKLKLSSKRVGGYYSFNMKLAGTKVSMPVQVHKLVAYQKFGETMFITGIEVRHLDGNSTNNLDDNIVLGTRSQNELDKSRELRKRVASIAGSAHSPHNWQAIEFSYFHLGKGFKRLKQQYAVPLGTLSAHFNNIPGWSPSTRGKGNI